MLNRHHLLEIILWPNEDGTFKTIINSVKRLKELGIYDDWKLTIKLTPKEHGRLHGKYISDEFRLNVSRACKGVKHNTYKPLSEETKAKMKAAAKARWANKEYRTKMLKARGLIK